MQAKFGDNTILGQALLKGACTANPEALAAKRWREVLRAFPCYRVDARKPTDMQSPPSRGAARQALRRAAAPVRPPSPQGGLSPQGDLSPLGMSPRLPYRAKKIRTLPLSFNSPQITVRRNSLPFSAAVVLAPPSQEGWAALKGTVRHAFGILDVTLPDKFVLRIAGDEQRNRFVTCGRVLRDLDVLEVHDGTLAPMGRDDNAAMLGIPDAFRPHLERALADPGIRQLYGIVASGTTKTSESRGAADELQMLRLYEANRQRLEASTPLGVPVPDGATVVAAVVVAAPATTGLPAATVVPAPDLPAPDLPPMSGYGNTPPTGPVA